MIILSIIIRKQVKFIDHQMMVLRKEVSVKRLYPLIHYLRDMELITENF